MRRARPGSAIKKKGDTGKIQHDTIVSDLLRQELVNDGFHDEGVALQGFRNRKNDFKDEDAEIFLRKMQTK